MMNEIGKYTITVQGQVDAAELNADSPWRMKVVEANSAVTRLAVRTDQSGLVGLIRHLHNIGIALLAINGDAAAPLRRENPPAGAPATLSRRHFLKGGGLTLAAAGLSAAGVTALAPDPSPVYFPSFTYGDNQMSKRILVAYATYAGSTADVAAAIGETLGERHFAVDVKPIKDNPSLTDYHAVVLGSAVQHGRWLPEAMTYVEANQAALQTMPAALFCVHIQNTGDDAKSQRNRLAYLDEVRLLVDPVTEGFFAGRFDRRGAELILPGLLARLTPPLDFRKWEKIHGWAEKLGFFGN
jgi:menaquinone-dependent protoporphyrinogen oxidase